MDSRLCTCALLSLFIGCRGFDTEPALKDPVVIASRPYDALAFVRMHPHTTSPWTGQLFVAGADGTNPRALTDTLWNIEGAQFAPDGKRIAIVGSPTAPAAGPSAAGGFGLYLIARDGTGLTRIASYDPLRKAAEDSPGFSSDGPSWSADGKFVLVTGNTGLVIVNADGSGSRKVTRSIPYDFGASFSTDGKVIAFKRLASANSLADVAVFAQDTGGNVIRQLTPFGKSVAGYPTFSPDGTVIIFSALTSMTVSNLDGSAQLPYAAAITNTTSFALRPDGIAIAFAFTPTCCSGLSSIYVAPIPAGPPVRVTDIGVIDRFPSWGAKQ